MWKAHYVAVNYYDLRLLALAIFVCALATFTLLKILAQAHKTSGYVREIWLWTAAAAGGFGIWAMHFIAMLAYNPGIQTGYNLGLTVLPLFGAILLTGVGLSVSVAGGRAARLIGGSIVGAGAAAAQCVGMFAYEVAGRVVWSPIDIVVSALLCAALGAIAFQTGMRGDSWKSRCAGAGLLTLAIGFDHLLAINAIAFAPDPAVKVPAFAISAGWLAIGAALASLAIVLLAFAGLAIDIRERRRAKLEDDRMRGLADAAAEGLLVCDGDEIVTINSSLVELSGCRSDDLIGAPLETLLPDEESRRALVEQPRRHLEGKLRRADGEFVPAEFILRNIDYRGKPHHAIAVRDLRDRKKAEEHIKFLAHHDCLTGLPNRNTFDFRLDLEIERHQRAGLSLAVFCLDLDRFKEVNDTLGHPAGDALLKRVAESVGAVLDQDHMMARLGGDEFAILATNIANRAAASRLAKRVIEALRRQTGADSSFGPISASIGIAFFPHDAEDRRGLLTHADTALYRAKADGRSVYRFFDAKMGVEARDRRLLEHSLRNALAQNELRLVYQPQARASSGKVVGFEALLRWSHPELGEVSPDRFIPIAEEGGLIVPIGEWVLRTACRDAAAWDEPLEVAVNVSAVQLHRQNFPRLVHEILLQTGLSPRRLELEITETALIRDLNRGLATLRQLKALGVRIAMDDFGTGYSSLSNLRAFPFDKIKIDKSFIKTIDAAPESRAIVRAVLGLGRGLGLPVLAEGVETSGELDFLNTESCDEIQGWIIGRPANIETFRQFTHNGERRATPPGQPSPQTPTSTEVARPGPTKEGPIAEVA